MSREFDDRNRAAARGSFAAVAEAGPLWLTSTIEGRGDLATDTAISEDDEVRRQCVRAYSGVRSALAAVDPAAALARLEHFTSSQSWLGVRQRVRAEFFGQPAPVASFGIPTAMPRGSLLNVSAIAARGGVAHRVVVPGDLYGMPAIATAVQVGHHFFVSGLLPRTPSASAAASRDASSAVADVLEQLDAVLQQCGCSARNLLRIDYYVAPQAAEQVLRAEERQRLGAPSWARSVVQARMTALAPVELVAWASTAQSAARSEAPQRCDGTGPAAATDGDLIVIGDCAARSTERAAAFDQSWAALTAALEQTGGRVEGLRRLEVIVRDAGHLDAICAELAQRLPDARRCALSWACGEPVSGAAMLLRAIAVRGSSARAS